MRGFGLMAAAVVGLLLAVSVPVRAESAGREPEAGGKAKAARQKAGAAGESTKASEQRKAASPASDTLVVAASGPDHPGFTMVGESVTYADPTFVPYKLREAARRARANADLASIP